ncbi:uncharacterized protein BDZ99DRAFT_501397 [Mytilinidion resinicola]|uniref:Uncharacterized protein n=1 Tax=Mytilinidion resinicola TaxID=574789 RepID=A0A6A6YAE2_9PEZI|nr:uncharacterized protein BDZ99DRAFT_501397 [Mytilinidion resinicola]KAF2805791.1 hypothetical protein BDZ99DRAFT_501397 [Mytilinidion resinicola]
MSCFITFRLFNHLPSAARMPEQQKLPKTDKVSKTSYSHSEKITHYESEDTVESTKIPTSSRAAPQANRPTPSVRGQDSDDSDEENEEALLIHRSVHAKYHAQNADKNTLERSDSPSTQAQAPLKPTQALSKQRKLGFAHQLKDMNERYQTQQELRTEATSKYPEHARLSPETDKGARREVKEELKMARRRRKAEEARFQEKTKMVVGDSKLLSSKPVREGGHELKKRRMMMERTRSREPEESGQDFSFPESEEAEAPVVDEQPKSSQSVKKGAATSDPIHTDSAENSEEETCTIPDNDSGDAFLTDPMDVADDAPDHVSSPAARADHRTDSAHRSFAHELAEDATEARAILVAQGTVPRQFISYDTSHIPPQQTLNMLDSRFGQWRGENPYDEVLILETGYFEEIVEANGKYRLSGMVRNGFDGGYELGSGACLERRES